MGIGSDAEDYKQIMVKLTPTGSCWPIEDDTTWVKLLEALAQEYAMVDAAAIELVQEAFPDTTSQLLPNWERVMGLPDIFSDPNASEDERRNVVLAKIRARGGQSADYLSDLIQTIGYDNTIIECTPFMADVSEAGDYLFGAGWVHYFIVLVHEPVANKELFEARVRALQPAHTTSIFIYEEG